MREAIEELEASTIGEPLKIGVNSAYTLGWIVTLKGDGYSLSFFFNVIPVKAGIHTQGASEPPANHD